MSFQSIDLDLDDKIIVKLDNSYYEGNIFMDDGGIAVCKFSSFLVELDVSKREKVNLTILFDLFEDEISEVYGQIIEFYDTDEYLSLAEEIVKSISDKSVKHYCNRIIKQMTDDTELEVIIEYLDQLIEDSSLDPSEIPLPEDNCVYHATRSLFFIRGRKSRINQSLRRFTIAKRVMQFLVDSDKYSIRLELVNSHSKVLFHVSEDTYDRNVILIETKKILNNGRDGSKRINLPQAIYKKIVDENVESELYIQFKGDLIEFFLCEP